MYTRDGLVKAAWQCVLTGSSHVGGCIMCVLLYIGIYQLGLCKCSIFWLQSLEVGDNYYV